MLEGKLRKHLGEISGFIRWRNTLIREDPRIYSGRRGVGIMEKLEAPNGACMRSHQFNGTCRIIDESGTAVV